MQASERPVAVIGAGAIGIISALELVRRGHPVTVIEPGQAGGEQAASYGNAGWLSCQSIIPPSTPGMWKKVPGYLLDPLGPLAIRWGYLPKVAPWLLRYLLGGCTLERVRTTAGALAPLQRDSLALHAALAAEAGVPHLIAAGGVVQAYPDRAAFEAEQALWQIRADCGIRWQDLDGDAVQATLPGFPARYRCVAVIEQAGRCRNPGAYVAALADLARRRGVAFVQARAQDFTFEGDRLTAVITDHGPVPCRAAVVAAGAWSGPLTARLHDRMPLESERGYHVMLPGMPLELPASFMMSDGKAVVQAMEHGLRIAGQVEIGSPDAPPDWRRADILKTHLGRLFPALDLSAARVWQGSRPAMPDGRPCLGRSRRSPDVIYAFGHGHIGLGSSARTGRVVAALVGGQAAEIPLERFDPQRFR
ncbi:NAD(P)/FAD-dependent oxidoreductase [Insolitispirillum peregrinum]|uniref:D-amino-acid dehydrogenase n=1 Tax=Insolitispirillum peregrinum TaxID=80876 RepID=A0A1N7PP54_9PROT|nr:FAD-dependent oxidoreductase [Insolitispirillum peregrinum]SIT12371.1 D-amino-acid dehydrogenase [Insolitispirillum peregrinum]